MNYKSLAKWFDAKVITEGGRVFKTTTSIQQNRIADTVQHLYDNVLKPMGISDKGKDWQILGSVGKKTLPSNDIDIAIVKPIKEVEKYIRVSVALRAPT